MTNPENTRHCGSGTVRLVSSYTSWDSTASSIQKTAYLPCASSPVLFNWRPVECVTKHFLEETYQNLDFPLN